MTRRTCCVPRYHPSTLALRRRCAPELDSLARVLLTDLEACVWLEDHLSAYPKCLLVVSHSQDFLNAVCTHTVWLDRGTLKYYGGSYSKFCATVEDEERLQLKVYEKQQVCTPGIDRALTRAPNRAPS